MYIGQCDICGRGIDSSEKWQLRAGINDIEIYICEECASSYADNELELPGDQILPA